MDSLLARSVSVHALEAARKTYSHRLHASFVASTVVDRVACLSKKNPTKCAARMIFLRKKHRNYKIQIGMEREGKKTEVLYKEPF